MEPHPSAAREHAHPTPTLYLRVALVLFTLTALEVGGYEIARRPGAPLHEVVQQLIVPILLILSAAKFALVAMFYMHLKQDSRIYSGLFVFPLIIAGVLIAALIALFAYLRMVYG
jgi:caa(3)-type oxidase subunit IV